MVYVVCNPAPSRNLSQALLAVTSQDAEEKLGIQGTATDAGVWFGILGSCARKPNGSLDCTGSSLHANYNTSLQHLADAGIPLEVLSQLPNVSAVPPFAFVVTFLSILLGGFLHIAGVFPLFAPNYQGPFGRRFNRIPGVWRLKSQLLDGPALWLLRFSAGFLSLSWVFGFTAAISLSSQFYEGAAGFNAAYSEFLSLQDPSTLATFPFIAAHSSPCFTEFWITAVFIGLSTILTFLASHYLPSYLEPVPEKQVFETSYAESMGMGSVRSATSSSINKMV